MIDLKNVNLDSFEEHELYDYLGYVATTNEEFLRIVYFSLNDQKHLDILAKSLYHIAKVLGTLPRYFDIILDFEFTGNKNSETILRANSLTTKSIDALIKDLTPNYIEKHLKDCILKTIDPDNNLEVDPNKFEIENEEEKEEKVNKQTDMLSAFSSEFLDLILNHDALVDLPFEIRYISRIIADLSFSLKWSISPILGNLMMLRIFNPSIMFPEKISGLGIQTVGKLGRRNLILISKLLQNLANGVEFGSKEPYMIPMNKTIQAYQEKVVDYLMKVPCSKEEYTNWKKEQEALVPKAFKEDVVYKQSFDNVLRIHEMVFFHQSKFDVLPQDHQLFSVIPKLPKLQSSDEKNSLLNIEEDDLKIPPTTYEKTLSKAKLTDTSSVAKANLITFPGKTKHGLPIACFTEIAIHELDLNLVFLHIIKVLDSFVKDNYAIVWCVDNSNKVKKPGFSWLLSCYNSMSRDFKKNLKELYLLHPTFLYKTIINFFKPFVSKKFWSKFHTVDRVSDIFEYVDKAQIPLHAEVLLHNMQIGSSGLKAKKLVTSRSDNSLQVVKNQPIISPGYQQLFKYLAQKDYVQGIFKISGRNQEVGNLIKLIDNGDEINFNQSDIHAVASSLKYFFKELDPPLLTYDKYDDFLSLLNTLNPKDVTSQLQTILFELPAGNFDLTRDLFSLLHKIHLKSDVNQMNAEELGKIWGTLLLKRTKTDLLESLKNNSSVQKVIALMILEYPNIFIIKKRKSRNSAMRFQPKTSVNIDINLEK